MKKNTIKSVFLSSLFFGSIAVMSAQTPAQKEWIKKRTNSEELLRLSEKFGKEFKENRDEAYRLAEINGWKKTFVTEQGAYAELMGVYPSGKPMYFVTNNANAAFSSGIDDLNSGGDLGLELDGQGMYIGMWDQERPRASHNTFGGRLFIADAALVQSNHPTHVMGTMIGSGVGSANNSARGMAPEAEGMAYNWDNDASEMSGMASVTSDDGLMLVSNHSYGSIAGQLDEYMFGAYTGRSQQYDYIAYNAPYYLIVQAAGNDRGSGINPGKAGYDLINGTKTAKNAVTVAAVSGLSAPYSDPMQVQIASFSSYGPTDDNRIKPDISAKGVNVYSSIESSNSSYGNLSGTSMASPVVAGGALLLQQYYSQVNDGTFMRAATLRGLICHTADEAGWFDGPDPRFGWGLFDAKKAAQAIGNNGVASIIDERVLNNGGTYTKTVYATGNEPLQVSICWSDPIGPVNNGTIDDPTPVLINNLDVKVTKDGTTYYPWKLGAFHEDPAEQAENDVDNIERVDIINPASGNYTITVTHKGILSGGPQLYSLIVTGIDETSGVNDNAIDGFTVWPNPVNDILNITLNSDALSGTSASIYDMQGRLVYTGALAAKDSVINTDSFSPGMYMVTIKNGKKQQTKKIIVK